MAFDMDEYKTVPARIADFKAKHPEGSFQPADPTKPYTIEQIGSQTFLVVVTAAYRTPDDPTPGMGMAWEPFPGKTNFTRDSELQNAETSSWGRAIVAALASESKNVASTEDVRNRAADNDPSQRLPEPLHMTASQATAISQGIEHITEEAAAALREWWKGQGFPGLESGRLTRDQADLIASYLRTVQDETDAAPLLPVEEEK